MQGSEIKPGERVKDVRFTEDTIAVDLIDGRTIIVPLAWYPRLLNATSEQRRNWRISGAGYGIHWPDLDEDLSTEDSCAALQAHPSQPRLARRSFSGCGVAMSLTGWFGSNSEEPPR